MTDACRFQRVLCIRHVYANPTRPNVIWDSPRGLEIISDRDACCTAAMTTEITRIAIPSRTHAYIATSPIALYAYYLGAYLENVVCGSAPSKCQMHSAWNTRTITTNSVDQHSTNPPSLYVTRIWQDRPYSNAPCLSTALTIHRKIATPDSGNLLEFQLINRWTNAMSCEWTVLYRVWLLLT